ncbi:MAG TPA: alpha-amylase family glycosyl hydrolase [Actinomycetota bacterium]|nr:alpha-amylase family glycosyl hydrolase [Actinomycetota bacterium]
MRSRGDIGDRGSDWWKHGVLYQVYPRSFQDSDGDGVGDLRGIIQRLDHLAWLGIDGVWLNPVSPSPNRDWGYDVSDYLDVSTEYGGLDALKELIEAASDRGIRVVLDLVPNHTSDQHPWFLDARSGGDAQHRDWYVWADPANDGGPPNNWRSSFGGPAWTLDESSGQYYLHNFLPHQPDLNWWNEDVRAAFDGILRGWFDRGVAGFRIDVANAIVKDRLLRDDPVTVAGASALDEPQIIYSMHRPEVHDVLRRWRAIADAYDPPRVLIGETWVRDLPELASYYGEGTELHLAFNFAFATAPFEATALRAVIDATELALGTDPWPLWTASNHDIGRLATRWASGDERRVRCALFVLLLLRGTPTLYAGDEIGLEDVEMPSSRWRDEGSGPGGRSRDSGRTPIPWEPGPGHGFTSPGVEPWLPIGGAARSVAEQRADPHSTLVWCQKVIALRRRMDDLASGAQELLDAEGDVLAWKRGDAVTVAANLSPTAATMPRPGGELVLASDGVRLAQGDAALKLPPWGCAVVRRHV